MLKKTFSSDWKVSIQAFLRKDFYLVIALAVCTPLYLSNMLKHSVPMGYAGLFTQMAKQIADANFSLPSEAPFYGPGGMPFVYPPVGLYFFAILIKLTGKYFIFLRILPPLLGLVSFIPLYYLTLELSRSRVAAMSAVIIAGGSLELYEINAWSAGIVRTPAFIFSLLTIYFYLRLINTGSRSYIPLAGIFLGLTFMSHLVYALFCFLWFWWWSIWSRDILKRIKDAVIISLIGFLVAAFWLLPILLIHGLDVFVLAFGSHGGDTLLSFWSTPSIVLNVFIERIIPISSKLTLAILVLVGVLFLLVTKNATLPLFYLLIILGFPNLESARFVFLVGSIVAGIGLAAIVDLISKMPAERWRPVIAAGVLISILGFLSWRSFIVNSRQRPHFFSSTIELANYVQADVPPGQKYLALLQQDEAEWLPFLFQRTPVVGKWGGEWLGTYTQQIHVVSLFRGCQLAQDWVCVKDTFTVANVDPEYIISYIRDRRLNDQIQLDSAWQKVYENDRYVVWMRQ